MKKICFALVFALVVSSTAFAFATSAKNQNGKNVNTQKDSKQTVQTTESKTDKQKEQTSDAAVHTKEKTKITLSEKKQLVLKKYTSDELSSVTTAGKAIKEADSTVTVLDVNSIVSSTKEFKFDTPPVIKGSRTLIPVRAITEGLGAQVAYDQATKEVTITKDGTTIQLTLGSNVALVNGKEVTLDTKANTMNNRTYVPMRFIMETFKLKVTYDDGTIEVEEPAGTTSGSAIETTTSAIETTTSAVETTTSAVQTTTSAVETTTSAIQ
ncbi:MAG: stalk domain-containing protein [Aminipila sp.]